MPRQARPMPLSGSLPFDSVPCPDRPSGCGRLGKGAELIQGLGQASYQRLLDPSGAVTTVVFLPRGGEG